MTDHDPAIARSVADAIARLPRHERLIFRAMCDGESYADIAKRLGVSLADVERAFADALRGIDRNLADRKRGAWRRWLRVL